MRAYQILPGANIDGLQCIDYPDRSPGHGEVRIRVHAVSLNYRDLMVASGNYLVNVDDPIIPCSDGAGEVLEIGPGVAIDFPSDVIDPAGKGRTGLCEPNDGQQFAFDPPPRPAADCATNLDRRRRGG